MPRGADVAHAALFIVAGSFTLCARTDAQTLQFRQLTPDNGLQSSRIGAIQQDSRGFMWFGSRRGLSRYDGYVFTVYRHRNGDTTSLADSRIITLHEDHDKSLWIGTELGLSRYDPARDAFTNFRLSPSETLAVNTIAEAQGMLLVGTTRGLYVFDGATGKASPYGGGLFASYPIWRVYEDRAKHVWVGTETAGAFDFDPVKGTAQQWTHVAGKATSLPGRDARGFHEDSAGGMWVSLYDAGLARLDRASGIVTSYSIDPRDPLLAASKRILSTIPEGTRGLWLGTENGGLDYFDFATKQFHHNRYDPKNPAGINNNSVWALYRDRGGIIWAGTFAGGVNISKQHGDAIHSYRTVAGDPRSLSFNSVMAFKEDARGDMWVGTDGGGLNRFDRRTGGFTRYTSRNSTLNSDAVLAIAEDGAGMLWLGTWAGGLSRFDPRSGVFTAFTNANSGLATIGVFSVLVDRAGIVWIGTWREGLQRYDPVTRAFTRYALAPTESPVRAIVEASDGTLLIATESSGFFVFDPRANQKTRYEAGTGGLSSDQVTSVVESEPGVVWIGTFAGLDRLDRKTNKIQHFSEADGLASAFVAGLVVDGAHDLWVTGDRGLTRFDPAGTSDKRYSISEGLQGNEFNFGSVYRSRDGTLYFGGTQGFNTLRPDSLVHNTHVPQIAITGFLLSNKPVPIGAPDSPLRSSITVARELVLQHDQSVLTFEFAALDFAAPEKNQYAYKLDGLDKNWNEVGTKRTASYTNLPVGHYTFRVKGSNNDDVWNDAGASISLEVLPPYWASWWFRTLVMLALAAVALALVRSARARRAEVALAARRRAANEERQRLEANIRHLLDASGEGIFGLDTRGDITFVNRRGSEMLGFEPEELVGHSMHALTHHSTREGAAYPESTCPIQCAARDGVACEVDDEVMWRKDGTPLQVEYAASPVRADGQLTGAVVNFRDITARRSAELELILARDAAQAANRAKSDFLARMSHELRTPLNSIIGFANVLLRNKHRSLKAEELTYLERIAGSGKHLLGLINDILDLSKIEAGRMTLDVSTVMLDTLVRATVAELEALTKDNAIMLRTEIPIGLRSVETDAGRMKQVLINLIGNALKFTERGEVVVSIEADQYRRPIRLMVRDTGIGIPRDRLAAIFNVFEQADSTTTRRFGGTGLGLALSRAMCELMGHRLDVESVEGEGTVMIIRLGSPERSWRRITPLGAAVIPAAPRAQSSS